MGLKNNFEVKKRKIRADKIAYFCKPFIREGDRILDVGCGDGKLAFLIKESFGKKVSLTGTDVLDYNPPFKFKKIKNNNIPFKDNEFNIAIVNDVLHHTTFDNQINVIKESLRVAKKVLIFEVEKGFTGRLVDIITNKIHDSRVNLPLTMRTLKDWENLFRKNNLKFRSFVSRRSFNQLFLLKNYFFVVENDK